MFRVEPRRLSAYCQEAKSNIQEKRSFGLVARRNLKDIKMRGNGFKEVARGKARYRVRESKPKQSNGSQGVSSI